MSTVQIESIDSKAQGVAHHLGKTLFVEGALPFERVEYNVYKKKSTFDLAKCTRLIKESSSRVVPRCPHFGICGGCVLQHMDLSAQVASKARVLEDALKHIGNVGAEEIFSPIMGSAWHYRHRARLSVRFVEKKSSVLVGFHEKKSSFVAEMYTCPILPQKLSGLLDSLKQLIGSLSIFNQIPQIELALGEECLALVLRILAPLSQQDENRLKQFADEHAVVFYLQQKGPDSVVRFYPAEPELFYVLPEFQVKMPFLPTDFTQVNHSTNTILVRRALALLNPQPEDGVLDFFCGLGNFTLPIARRGARVLGLEGNASLVLRAKQNAKHNALPQAEFAVQNLFEESFFEHLEWSAFNKILLDPPREGAIALVKSLPENAAQKIVYVSCNPATLARDAAVLVHCKNYVLKGAGVVNMFSHTAHVESIAVFEKNPR